MSAIVKPSASTTFLRVTYPTCVSPLRIRDTVITDTPAFFASFSLVSRCAPIAALITSILYGELAWTISTLLPDRPSGFHLPAKRGLRWLCDTGHIRPCETH